MKLECKNKLLSFIFLTVVLFLNHLQFDFNQHYSLNLTSLYSILEAQTGKEFDQDSPYSNDLFYHPPLIYLIFNNLPTLEYLIIILTLLVIITKQFLSSFLELSQKQDLLFSLLFLLNPFLIQQILHLDTRIFDLFLIAVIFKTQRKSKSVFKISCALSILFYLRTQNLFIFASLIYINNKQMFQTCILFLLFVFTLFFASFKLVGDLVI